MSEIITLGKSVELANEITGGEPRVTPDSLKRAIADKAVRGGNLDGGPWEIEADSVREWAETLKTDSPPDVPETPIVSGGAIRIVRGVSVRAALADHPHAPASGILRAGTVIEKPSAAELGLVKRGFARFVEDIAPRRRRK